MKNLSEFGLCIWCASALKCGAVRFCGTSWREMIGDGGGGGGEGSGDCVWVKDSTACRSERDR